MSIISLLTSIDPVAAVCFILGLILVIFEMFHPGLSFPGVLGGILLIVGVVLTAKSIFDVIVLLILVFAILGIALTIVVHSATKGHLSQVLVLSDSLDKEVRNSSCDEMEYFVGNEGITITPLRPSGSTDFDGVRLDVISEGEFVEKGRRVRIIRMEDRKFVVKEIK